MDLFETLGSAIIGDIDTARERADARAIHELHKADDSKPVEYVVTVEMIVSATSEDEAKQYSRDILDTAQQEMRDLIDIDITGAFEA